jgi:hypothetical protein
VIPNVPGAKFTNVSLAVSAAIPAVPDKACERGWRRDCRCHHPIDETTRQLNLP